jgi:hypothetical protein
MSPFHKALLGPKDAVKMLRREAPEEMAALEAALKAPSKPAVCEECLNTGICGDEGPGMRNAHLEWRPCDCPAGRIHKTIPECLPEHKAEQMRLKARITVLEEALNELYHRTDCTTRQMEIINGVLPQKP